MSAPHAQANLNLLTTNMPGKHEASWRKLDATTQERFRMAWECQVLHSEVWKVEGPVTEVALDPPARSAHAQACTRFVRDSQLSIASS